MEQDYRNQAELGVENFLKQLIQKTGEVNGVKILEVHTLQEWGWESPYSKGLMVHLEGDHELEIQLTLRLNPCIEI